MNCDCIIGWLNDIDEPIELRLSNYTDVIYENVSRSKRINEKFRGTQLEVTELNAKDYLDKRRGRTSINNYCPNCGSKINLRNLRQNLK
jgi:hypothetical protein